MAHRGVFPLDPTTAVGALRVIVGDTASAPLEPAESGYAAYAVWSDDELAAALTIAQESAYRAAWSLYLTLAASAAQSGRNVRTDDLSIDTTKRGDSFLKIAQSFLDEAEAGEGAAANDFFQIVPFGGRAGRSCRVRPEATPWPAC